MMRKRGGLTDSAAPAEPVAVPFGAATIFVVVALLVSVVALRGPWSDVTTRAYYSDIGLIPTAGMMVISCAYAARRAQGRTRTAWRLFALAGALWTCGELSWAVEHYLLHVSVTTLSVSDLFSMVAVVPVAAALLIIPGAARTGREGMINLLGCGVVAFAVLFVARSAAVVLKVPRLAEATIDGLAYIVYPVSDIILVILVLVALIKTAEQARPALIVMAVGIVCYAAADTFYGIQAALGRYVSGSASDLGWFAGYLLMALAATTPGATENARPPRHRRRLAVWYSLLVYVPVLISAVVAACFPVPRFDAVLVLSGVALLVFFASRQVLLAIEHAALNQQQDDQVVELQEAGLRLRRQVLETRRITQSVADGVLVLDPLRSVVMANQAVARILQTAPDDLLGRRLDDLVDGDADADARVVGSIAAGELLTSVDTILRWHDVRVPVEVTVGPIVEADQVLGTVVSIRDVTARRAIEQMKNEFISVISHELRTPLTSIRGSLALLDNGMGGELQPTGARMVTLALQSSERLTRLIDDLLDVERLESGRLTMTYEDCDASRLVELALREMRGLAQQSEVRLVQLEVVGRVWADPDRVVQTLTNLISNAVKFSEAGDEVALGALPVERDGERFVEFSVRDEGRGIPAEKLETIFGRFEQVDSSDSRQRGGSGLGLAISRSIVELHGGRIWVSSELGRGSDFHFVLPVARSRAAAEEPEPTVDELEGSTLSG